MIQCVLVLITFGVLAETSTAYINNPLSDEFIRFINEKQDLWKAGRNFPIDTPLIHIKQLTGVLPDPYISQLKVVRHEESVTNNLPEEFDARDKWPFCPTLNEIRDQGSCGSCWAVAAVTAMSDRVCIFSNGTQHVHLSTEDLITCCKTCSIGCFGGQMSRAWDYWKESGIVSGGTYNSHQGCKPYEVPPCNHYINDTSGNLQHCNGTPRVPKCSTKCIPEYKNPYEKDRHFGTEVYTLKGEEHIMAEIYKNGPVETGFDSYPDLLSYKSGVYRHIAGGEAGGHGVKILGWGVENGTKYWLIANSWNTHWGDNGFFKFLRGENHCGIESSILAGIPLLKKNV